MGLFGSNPSPNEDIIRFDNTTNALNFYIYTGSYIGQLNTTIVYRDPSAWYHIVCVWDTTNATSTERMRMYVNGIRISSFVTETYPASSAISNINNNVQMQIGRYLVTGSNYFDGYMAEVNFVDGQALTPTSFGELDVNTGVWIPKAYSGTYGTNGFNLKFSDIALTTSSNTGLGKDFANSNYWTTNGISVTSGSTYDAMTDSPTNTSETIGNYATLNPLNKPTNIVLANGNLQATNAVGAIENVRSTIPTDNTYSYWEWVATTVGSSLRIEIGGILSTANVSNTSYLSISTGAFCATWDIGLKVDVNGSRVYTDGSVNLVANDVIQFAYDKSTGKLWIGLNGIWYNSGNPVAGTGTVATLTAVSIFPAVMVNGGGGTNSIHANFGQRPFAHTPPTGFKRLNTFNLPTPTIGSTEATLASKFMDITLYTGNGTNQSIGNSGFQPDLVWIKNRTSATDHAIYDSVRGATKQLSSNTTGVETTELTGLTSFNTVGFSVGSIAAVNTNANNYIAWQWRAGAAPVTNTGGTITSTVSVNTTAGFSIVRYTGDGISGKTVGHGLGLTPSMIIAKQVTTVGYDWVVWHKNLLDSTYVIYLNQTASQSVSTNKFNGTLPTSSVITLGNHGTNFSSGANNQILYAWAEIDGFSKFNSYVGNGSTDGTFVYTGFRPEFILIKCSTTTGNWAMFNSAANTSNPVINELLANSSVAENSIASNDIDFLSNGFKLRSTNGDINTSTATYIYAAFAEFPTKYANAALTQSLKPTIAVDYLVVAGGGGGGNFLGGGAGAGGFREFTGQTIEVGKTHSLIIGGGGVGGNRSGGATLTNSTSGNSSTFSTITSTGGGRGGDANVPTIASAGGSGGGGSGRGGSGASGNTPVTSPSQGNLGGNGSGSGVAQNTCAGGGGGSGASGGNGVDNSKGGDGGIGVISSITGVRYAGGGGGGADNRTAGMSGGNGGLGGGGNGGYNSDATAGTTNTGGGGGGGGPLDNETGGSGGSGVVIIRIPSTHVGLFSSGVGYTYSAISNNNIYTITGTTTTGETVSFVKSGDVVTVDYLVVAGGGGGGSDIAGGGNSAGGGGAGGYRYFTGQSVNKNQNYTVTVGGGGGSTVNTNGTAGNISTFNTSNASGGGGGGKNGASGSNGGSGGGAGNSGSQFSGGNGNSGLYSPVEGYGGGANVTASKYPAGGGGGSSEVGQVGTGTPINNSGRGGNGTANSITGITPNPYYAGGGGGGSNTDHGAGAGVGGTGGGGAGGATGNNGFAGANNTGGGGGGAASNKLGGSGGSGIVIIRIPNTVTAQFSQFVGFTSTGITNYNIYTITATTAINQTVTFV